MPLHHHHHPPNTRARANVGFHQGFLIDDGYSQDSSLDGGAVGYVFKKPPTAHPRYHYHPHHNKQQHNISLHPSRYYLQCGTALATYRSTVAGGFTCNCTGAYSSLSSGVRTEPISLYMTISGQMVAAFLGPLVGAYFDFNKRKVRAVCFHFEHRPAANAIHFRSVLRLVPSLNSITCTLRLCLHHSQSQSHSF